MREEFFVICQAGCGKRYTFDIDPEDYYRFQHGTFAQDAFPYLTSDQRELLISQTCGDCFNRMFPPDDDEFTDEEWNDLVTSLDQLFKGEVSPARTREEEERGE